MFFREEQAKGRPHADLYDMVQVGILCVMQVGVVNRQVAHFHVLASLCLAWLADTQAVHAAKQCLHVVDACCTPSSLVHAHHPACPPARPLPAARRQHRATALPAVHG